MSFKDHFSKRADRYAAYRPHYPISLFEQLSSLVSNHALAWDCATGNGQAAQGLARHFQYVVATDGSRQQLSHATQENNIGYCAALAEQTPLPNSIADLATIAQALHWLDAERFFAEVRRVLKPGGIIAVWCYNLMEIEMAVDKIVLDFYHNIVGPYWAPERKLLEEGYRSIPFPFEEITPPNSWMENRWSLEDVFGYLGTWSSSQKYTELNHLDPIDRIRDDLVAAWGDSDAPKIVRWPLSFRVGRT